MNLIRRLAAIGALILLPLARVSAQVIERPVPFDSAGLVTVMTPFLADKAALRPPWWPVSGEFTEARLFTANDSTYVLAVGRRTGVVERYNLTATDREAIRAVVSRLPREVIVARTDARNGFIARQTLLGLIAYGPTFAGAIANNDAGAAAGYLVVAGGSFFAASEISRRMLVTKPQTDLSFNLGHNGALAGWATMYLLHSNNHMQSAGAFIGGLTGAALGLHFANAMTEADAIGAGFGSDIGALIGYGAAETIRGSSGCVQKSDGTFDCGGRISDRGVVALVLASGIIGYPLGVLYPRNASYSVTPGDIQTLWPSAAIGASAASLFLSDDPTTSHAALALTSGGVVGMILGDRFLVRKFDHSRADGLRVTLGALAGGLMGAGIASLTNPSDPNRRLVSGMATAGGLIGVIATERYLDPSPDAGRRGMRLTVNPMSIFFVAAHTPGNHSLLNVRF
jgi:energy-converting hydrogenase Eha subunit C